MDHGASAHGCIKASYFKYVCYFSRSPKDRVENIDAQSPLEIEAEMQCSATKSLCYSGATQGAVADSQQKQSLTTFGLNGGRIFLASRATQSIGLKNGCPQIARAPDAVQPRREDGSFVKNWKASE